MSTTPQASTYVVESSTAEYDRLARLARLKSSRKVLTLSASYWRKRAQDAAERAGELPLPGAVLVRDAVDQHGLAPSRWRAAILGAR